MPTPDEPIPPVDPDVAAAELALGLLEGEERAVALRRQLAEPEFARDVERWRAHFATLFAASPEISPSAELAQRIEARLDQPTATVATPRSTSPGFWRPLALASSLAAASLAGVLFLQPTSAPPSVVPTTSAPAPSAQFVAALAPASKGTPLAAYYDPSGHVVRMPMPMEIPEGRSAQLWAIVKDKPPIPLGLFRIVGSTVIADAADQSMLKPGTMLAISIEPIGGSPTGLPTGPVVASGMLNKV